MPVIKWTDAHQRKPPIKERLLLIIAADDYPPDAQLEGQSEADVGYWTGDQFRFMRDGEIAHRVARWAVLAPCLPKDIRLKRDRRLDPDLRG